MRWKWMIKVFLLEICPYVYYVPPLIRGRLHVVRNTAAKKEVDIAIYRWHQNTLIRRSKKIEMDENSNF